MPLRPYNLWHNSDFLRLWVGQTISEIGSRITVVALPLIAVLVLKATPFQMSMVAGIGGLASLVFGLAAGLWVDRLSRKPILIVTDLGRAAVLGSIPVAAGFGVLCMPQIYVVVAVAGVLTLLFEVAYQSYLPSLVERDHMREGNSKLAMSSSIAEIAGPGLTGILVQLLTAVSWPPSGWLPLCWRVSCNHGYPPNVGRWCRRLTAGEPVARVVANSDDERVFVTRRILSVAGRQQQKGCAGWW